jgi:hypothetical protein
VQSDHGIGCHPAFRLPKSPGAQAIATLRDLDSANIYGADALYRVIKRSSTRSRAVGMMSHVTCDPPGGEFTIRTALGSRSA